MGKLRFILSNFWLWATVLMGCVYAENLAIFTSNPSQGYNNTTFWMITICCFLCLGIYLYLEHRKNHVKFDKILLPIIVGLGIIMVTTVFVQNSETFVYQNGKDSITVSFSVTEKGKYAIKLIFLLAFSYVTTFTMFANRVSNRSLLFLPIILLVVVYASVGYSIFKEANVIATYFRGISRESLQSFYLNPNTFGLTLLLGIMTCMVINYYKPNAFTYLSIPLFLFLVILTNSAASILVAFAIVPLYFIIEIFRNVRKHFLVTTVISAVVILGIAGFVILVSQLADQHNLFVENIIASLRHFFDNIHFDTVSGRGKLIADFLAYGSDNTLHTLFGRGFGTGEQFIRGFHMAHYNRENLYIENSFMQIFICFGLVGVLAYIALLGYFFYSTTKLFLNKHRTFALTYAICVLGLLANSFAENNSFYDLGFKETTMTLVFLMPPIVKAKFLTHKEKVEETISYKGHSRFEARKVGEITSMILLLAIAATGAAFLSPYGMNNPTIFFTIILGCFSALLILPYLITLWLMSDDPVKRVLHVTLNLVFLFGLIYFIFVLGKGQTTLKFNILSCSLVALVFLLVDLVIYALIRKDLFVSYLRITFINPLVACFPSYICGFALTIIFMLITLPMGQFGALETFGVILFYIIAFFIGVFFLPYRPMKKYTNYINDLTISRWKTFMLRGDK